MFTLIMIFVILTGQFGRGLLACFCVLVGFIMIDVLTFFVWASFLLSLVSSILPW